MRRYGYSVAGATIAVILGPGLESYLRRGLLLLDGDWWAFMSRPWTGLIFALSIGFLIYASFGTVRLARRAAAIRRQAVVGLQAPSSSDQQSKGGQK
jgi:putative tricarboxylic transport membrane protein